MLQRLREMGWLAAGAVGAGLIVPQVAAAETNRERAQLPNGDRYERVIPQRPREHDASPPLLELEAPRTVKAHASRSSETGPDAAKIVVDAVRRLKRDDVTCRVRVTRLGAIGIVECKGSAAGKRKVGKEIKRLVREGKIIRPQGYDWYIGVWNRDDQKVIRIDRAFFGYHGIPA